MRVPLLLALVLAACSSDPAPVDSGPADTGAPLDAPVADVGDDRPAPIDLGTPDAGVDVSFHTDPIPLADLGFDLGVADAGSDAADVAGDQPGDVPADARIVCTNDDVRCTTNEECQAVCLPGSPGSGFVAWCCPGRHHCIPTADPRGCGPYLNP